MKFASALALALLLAGTVSCRKREVVTAGETRPLTMRDENLKLDASNAERFGPAGTMPGMMAAPESPLAAGVVPEGWSEAPASAMRLINYRFGTGGQVYLSLSRGGVLENVNRWRKQFTQAPLDSAGLEALETATMPGYAGVWVEIEGDFGGGMGQPAQRDYALAGVVAAKGEEILTVKMVGPKDEVEAEKARLREFVAGLEEAR